MKCYIIKNNSWKKLLWWEIEIGQKQAVPRNTGARVLLSVKVLVFKYKNDSTKIVFLETFRKFPKHLDIIDFRD